MCAYLQHAYFFPSSFSPYAMLFSLFYSCFVVQKAKGKFLPFYALLRCTSQFQHDYYYYFCIRFFRIVLIHFIGACILCGFSPSHKTNALCNSFSVFLMLSYVYFVVEKKNIVDVPGLVGGFKFLHICIDAHKFLSFFFSFLFSSKHFAEQFFPFHTET